MNKYNRALMVASIANYRALGEAALSNLYGKDDFDGATTTQYVDATTRAQMGIGSISAQARLISLTVVNSHATLTQKVTLFGAYANSAANNYGNSETLLVTCDTVPYPQLLEQIKSNPMRFLGVRLVASGQQPSVQLTNIIRLGHSDATGVQSSAPYNPSLLLSPLQNIANIIQDDNFDFVAAGDSFMEFDVQPATTVKFILGLQAQTDLARVLNGKSALEVSSATTLSSAATPQLVQVVQPIATTSSFFGRRG